MTFGGRLRELRIEKNLRQEDLAKIINVHRATIGKYETEERFPDKETLLLLADFFNVSVDFLLGRSNVRNPYLQEGNKFFTDLYVNELPDEAINRINEYVEFIKHKYSREEGKKGKHQL